MNKSDGGKQHIQHDTVIPESNPKMTLPDGRPKGLECVLTEWGFDLLSKQDDFINQASMLETLIKKAGHECIFLPKFHCKLNPIEMVHEDCLVSLFTKSNTLLKYWVWVKYRYQEVPKKNFTEAKDIALHYLNACPANVIRRFINCSWQFMSAYRKGLTGNAATWAVRKQKQHRQVSNQVMMLIDAVLNPN
ncbi:hypothetical protein L208DRAFT_1400618 [Tricholoma matsutake]|nr:hypothetical protein L208DRAFT_1400618 [Tricholoma matsutake 945]